MSFVFCLPGLNPALALRHACASGKPRQASRIAAWPLLLPGQGSGLLGPGFCGAKAAQVVRPLRKALTLLLEQCSKKRNLPQQGTTVQQFMD